MDVYQRRRLVALSALAAVFIIIVLLIRSCGGDDEETPVAPLGATGTGGVTLITQADYIAQGDAICLDANTTFAAVDQSDPVQAASDEADIVAGELEQLQSLPEPDDGTTKLGNFLNALEKQSAAYQDRATAVERGDSSAVTEIEATIEKAGDDAANAAENFGFEACGNPDEVSEQTGDETSGAESDSGETEAATTTTTPTDTGGTVTPTTPTTTTPVTPTTTTPVAPTEETAPPATDTGGGATPDAPPTDTGGDTGGTESGGVSP